VHLALSGVPGEPPCTGARATRDAWLLRRDELYEAEGLSEMLAVTTVEKLSLRMLALSIGAARRLPKQLALNLATAFVELWGEWSAERRGAADARVRRSSRTATAGPALQAAAEDL
jgi:hypothetical protein